MARRLIGLDVGTNAVTVAEVTPGNPPRLELFGQVALPAGAMREGEVADDAAVTAAVARLRDEVGLKKVAVRVGMATPRLIVRQIEMPVMTRDELASALQFQAADLIPIPIDEAVLDFAILGRDTREDGAESMRVLLAAAQRASVARLVAAVEAGGFDVAAVDLVPLAVIRAIGLAPARALVGAGAPADGEDHGGAESIVCFGGGVTAIAIHEHGMPRFVRVLSTGGRELTAAIATDLQVDAETAEALKRQLGTETDGDVARARTAIERPLSALLDDVRGSLDYYRNQPGAARLTHVVVTGGASQLPGLTERLSTLVGVPVDAARPRDVLALGDIGFVPEELPKLDPYMPAAVGLALGGADIGTVVDLRPRTKRGATTKIHKRGMGRVLLGVAAVVAVLAVPTFLVRQEVSDAKSERNKAQARATELQAEIQTLSDAQTKQQQLDVLRQELTTLLAADVSWPRMLSEISTATPDNVYLTSFQGVVAPPVAVAPVVPTPTPSGEGGSTDPNAAPTPSVATPVTPGATTPAAPSAISGTVTFALVGTDYPSVATWIENLSKDPSVDPNSIWVSSATAGADNAGVTFSSTARITDAARSDRLDTYVTKGAK